MIRYRIVQSSVIGFCALFMALAAKADTVDELMRQLKAKGVLTDQEYNALSQRRAAEQLPAPMAAAEPAPTPVATTAPAPAALLDNVVRTLDKGVGLRVGQVDILFSGSINAFYVHDMPEDPGTNTNVLGGIANVSGSDAAAVRNGLLPGNFSVSLKYAPGRT